MALKVKGISRITNWWKRNLMEEERIQSVMFLTEDNRIVDSSLPVKKGYTQRDASRMAWMLHSGNQVKDTLGGGEVHFMQVVCERAVTPLALWEPVEKKVTDADINKIAAETTDAEIFESFKKFSTNRNLWLIVAGISVIGICLLIAMLSKSCSGINILGSFKL
jgi:hypothetical protein